ncbi:cytochrome P450 [Sorangium cellulosum]|uniref:Cytochrome P450 n=1 Tax=Sorangium cellulosum TaxID=56 RepID=A0A4P2Q1W8_SORCE|nr:cytochrome P450 [Sorangium cellulosum]AUX23277.1 cytochrome P450 [Sorangium cellulosum]
MSQSSPSRALDIQFDPLSLEFTEDPQRFYAPMRERAPVYYYEPGRFWVLTRYADIDALTRDPRFTIDPRAWRYPQPPAYPRGSELEKIFDHNPFHSSVENHLRIRRLVAPSFSARAVAQLERHTRALFDELLARARADERDVIDFAAELAHPLPIRVIAGIFGVPREHQEAFGRWGYAILQQILLRLMAPHRLAETMDVAERGVGMMREIIADRRRRPGDDLLTQLIQAQEAGDRLTEDELVSLVTIIIAAGTDTTVHALNFALYNLLRHEDQRRLVQRDPSLLSGAMDELMRYDSSSKAAIPRFALEDLTIRGQPIQKGDLVNGYVGAAMHDPEVWPDADRLDVTRDPSATLSFGRGAHHCLGAHLVRLEGRVALGTLLERYPEMRLEAPPVYEYKHPIHRSMSSLKVRLRG